MWVPINSGNCSGSCSENYGFRIAQVVKCHSENGISHSENHSPNSESCSENTPRAPRMAFSLRAFFSKMGVVDRLLKLQMRWLSALRKAPLAGKKKAYTALLQCRTFLCPQKNGGRRGKISAVDMVFLVFRGTLYPPLTWKVFLWGQISSPKDFLSVVVVYAFIFSARGWVHRGRSDTAANANANSDASQEFASEFCPPNLKQKAANSALRRNSLANANGFANQIAKVSSSLRKFLANGSLRRKSLAIANAMAWCTQARGPGQEALGTHFGLFLWHFGPKWPL